MPVGWHLAAPRGRLSCQKGPCWAPGAGITQRCATVEARGPVGGGVSLESVSRWVGGVLLGSACLPSSRGSSLRLPCPSGTWRAGAAPCAVPALQLKIRSSALSSAEAGQHVTITGESGWASQGAFRGWRHGPWLQGWHLDRSSLPFSWKSLSFKLHF